MRPFLRSCTAEAGSSRFFKGTQLRRFTFASHRPSSVNPNHLSRRAIYPSIRPSPRHSAADPLTVLLAVGVSIGIGYLASTLDKAYPQETKEDIEIEEQPAVPTTPEDESVPGMPSTTPPGRPGNLTPEQEIKLKEFWLACLDVFGVAHEHINGTNGTSSAASSPSIGGESPDLSNKKRKSRLGFLGKSHKHEAVAGSDGNAEEGDKYGQTKEFKTALASMSPETLRGAFWSMLKHDNPDALLLRFLRARKWDVHNALVMLVSTMHWRAEEMHVDDDIMFHGEGGALQQTKTSKGSDKKDAEDFLALLGIGMSFLHGTDSEGRPMCFVRARLHKPNERTEKSLERYTVYIIETARLMLKPPVDTATIIFDMTGFSMANMDYTPVKFMIKCFEANYPESLGSVLVYKAPWIFQGIWKIIKGWLDPVVASKVHFASDEKELADYVPKSRIIKELGGEDDWKYTYIDPVEGENKLMDDKETRSKLESERNGMVERYEKATVAWAKGEASGSDRTALADQLRDNYWVLDPYVRARSVYDRAGLLGPGGKLEFYPSKATTGAAPAAPAVQAPQKVVDTNASDVD